MRITFNDKTNIFCLENDDISYCLMCNGMGYLQHLYFGRRVDIEDASAMTALGWDWPKTYLDETSVERNYTDNYFNDRSLMEVAHHGAMDKAGAPFIIKKADGSTATRFKYRSHRIYDGKPAPKGMPATTANADAAMTLEVTLCDDFSDMSLVLSYTIFDGINVVARNARLVNGGAERVNVLRAYSLQLDLPSTDFDLLHFYGDWSLERFAERTPVTIGRIDISSNYGRSSHEHNPFGILCQKDAGENSGEAYAFSLVYSGNFTLSVNGDKFRRTRVLMGINDEDFDWELAPGEEFYLPEGIMAYSSAGFNGISHAMHDLVRDRLIRYKNAKAPRPILFNSWEGCYLDFNTQTVLSYMESAAKAGAELFVLDDGWFGKRDSDDRSLGDWQVYEQKIDLGKVIQKCRSLGMKFGLWFEPEMINPVSELYKAHPEYALGRGADRTLSRHQLALDMTNEQAVEYIYRSMCDILDKYPVDYIKWDHNRNIGELTGCACPYGRAYHSIVLGTYALLERLQQRYPNIFFEGCASGGGRFDPGMLYYCPQIWTSDETDPVQRLFIQYGTSYAYPLSAMGSHISKSQLMSYTGKGNIALFGTYGIEMDPRTLTESDLEQVKEVNKKYKAYHNRVIQNGDLYRLLSPFEGNYMAQMCVSKDKKIALVLFANLLKETNRYRFVRLAGLDSERMYKNDLDGSVHTGEYYMRVGLNLSRWLEEFSTFVITLEVV